MTSNYISLAEAARKLQADSATLRRALNRFSLNERRADGQRILPAEIFQLFEITRRSSGYFYPREINTREKLLAAAEKMVAG